MADRLPPMAMAPPEEEAAVLFVKVLSTRVSGAFVLIAPPVLAPPVLLKKVTFESVPRVPPFMARSARFAASLNVMSVKEAFFPVTFRADPEVITASFVPVKA